MFTLDSVSHMVRSTRLFLAISLVIIYFYLRRTSEVVDNSTDLITDKQNDFSKGNWFERQRESPVCPEYTAYASKPHPPYSLGPLGLPFMRPAESCRTFRSQAVDNFIDDMKLKIKDPDLSRIFENALPNTLDTTILWYDLKNPRTFISTGDIHAEWLRDSARQLSVYQQFIPHDNNLKALIKGAILQQAVYIAAAPYCNAFQPPPGSKVSRKPSSIDSVSPPPPWKIAFECKWELDSLASFLTLTNEYLEHSKDYAILKDDTWIEAFKTVLKILERESSPTFDQKSGKLLPIYYTFRRNTNIGSETLPLSGSGNPVNWGTGLIRSAFRPSDDACIYQFFVPANAQMAVELKKISTFLKLYSDPKYKKSTTSEVALQFSREIKKGIEQYAITNHPKFGEVFAYEIDGFGGISIMDDANIPSLLSLPDMGFVDVSDEIYQNTRKMILSKEGNPYFLKGKHFRGIGGPHVGLNHAWPMSLLVQIRTSDDDNEIMELLELLKKSTGGLGLMHEGVHVESPKGKVFTRPWFSWCNSEFGKTIIYLAQKKPWLILHEGETVF